MRHTSKFGLVASVGLLAFTLAACSTGAADNDGADTGSGENEAIELPADVRTPTGEHGEFADLLPTEIAERGQLVAAGSGQVAPLQFISAESDDMVGIVVDLTAEYAHRLGLEMVAEQASGSGTIPGVESGRYDVALAAGDFAERRTTLDFVDILAGGTVLVESAANPTGITSTDDLCGRSLSVSISSIQQSEAEELNQECIANGDEPIDLQAYDTLNSSVLAVQSGQAEVVWTDIAPANVMMAESPGVFAVAGELMWYAPYGVGVSVDNKELAEAILAALQSMHEDGTYLEILERWGNEELALDEIEINGSEF